jgi:hypothetical protein
MFGGFLLCWLWLILGCFSMGYGALQNRHLTMLLGFPMVIVGFLTYFTGISFFMQMIVYLSLCGAIYNIRLQLPWFNFGQSHAAEDKGVAWNLLADLVSTDHFNKIEAAVKKSPSKDAP